MDVSASLLLEVWEIVADILPNNKREDMARKLVNIFADKGMDKKDFEAMRGEDEYIDSAIDAQYNDGLADDDYDYDYGMEDEDE
jgi:hypothetical protein